MSPRGRKLRIALGVTTLVVVGAVASSALWFRGRRPTLEGRRAEVMTLEHGGLTRTYRVYVPETWKPGGGVVFMLHGGHSDGDWAEVVTLGRFNALAERDATLVVYPDAVDGHWNDGRDLDFRAHVENIDDAGFVQAIVEGLIDDHDADANQVFAVGISNGGFFALRLACEASDRVTAVASVVGGLAAGLETECEPVRRIPVLLMNGTADEVVGWDAREVTIQRLRRGAKLTVPETVKFWVGRNGCAETPKRTSVEDANPEDGTVTERVDYVDCRDGARVTLFEMKGAGHTWPGGWQYLPETMVGLTPRDFDAADVAWDFFKVAQK